MGGDVFLESAFLTAENASSEAKALQILSEFNVVLICYVLGVGSGFGCFEFFI